MNTTVLGTKVEQKHLSYICDFDGEKQHTVFLENM